MLLRRLRPPDGVPFAERPPDTLSADDMEVVQHPRKQLWDGTSAADADSGSYGGPGMRGTRVDMPADTAAGEPARIVHTHKPTCGASVRRPQQHLAAAGPTCLSCLRSW